MRVLMINRADARANPGGDMVQLENTRTALESFGIHVDVRLTDDLSGNWQYDVVHIFNIQTAAESWKAFQAAREHIRTVVLSPIYWEPYSFWFENARIKNLMWRLSARCLGVEPARQFYTHWQRAKRTGSLEWRMQHDLLTQCACVLPNAEAEAALLLNEYQLRHSACVIHMVPNGIKRELFDTLPRSTMAGSTHPTVIQVGTISPVKNQLGTIKALYDLDVAIVFVGQAAVTAAGYMAACQALARARGHTTFFDHIPHERLPQLYAGADVHVLPSWRETPGLASLEAAAAGCRIVSTSIGTAREYFGDQAFYCYPSDLGSIRKAVVRALAAPCSDALRLHVLNTFDWRNAGQATLSAYEMVLASQTL